MRKWDVLQTKKNLIFVLLQDFTKLQISTYALLRINVRIRYWKVTRIPYCCI